MILYFLLIIIRKVKHYCEIAKRLNIKINYTKSFVVPINRSFKYCNWKYRLLESGKIICKPCISTIKRQKKKLKKMIKLNICEEEKECTRHAFIAYLSLGNVRISHLQNFPKQKVLQMNLQNF